MSETIKSLLNSLTTSHTSAKVPTHKVETPKPNVQPTDTGTVAQVFARTASRRFASKPSALGN